MLKWIDTSTSKWEYVSSTKPLPTSLNGRNTQTDPTATRLTDGTSWIGSSNPLPIKETAPVGVLAEVINTTVVNGGFYETAVLDVSDAARISAIVSVSGSWQYKVVATWYTNSGTTTYCQTDIIPSAVQGNLAKDAANLGVKAKFAFVNNSGADKTVSICLYKHRR